jgi:galactose mutarotase-like enzyme
VDDKARAQLELAPTRIFDNVTKQYGPFEGFDLTAPEVDVHCLDHPETKSALALGDGRRIEVRGSADFGIWVVWTLAGKNFVCLEPWTAPGNALNTGEHLSLLEPGGTHVSRVEFELFAP